MSTTQQPEALVFANDRPSAIDDDLYQWAIDAEDLIRRQHARIAELEAARIAYASEFEPDADGDPDVGNIHANIRALKEQLSAIGAGGVEPLRNPASQQAVQAAVPVAHRHEFTDGHRTLKQDVFSAIHDYAATKPEQDPDDPESWESWFEAAFDLLGTRVGQIFEEHAERSAPVHPAEGVPVQIETLRSELAEEKEAADNWRKLALQFDHHRLQALGHLKAILHPDSSVDEYKDAELFLKAPPLDGESVLAQRIAKLSAAATQAQEDARDVERWMGIGKAIERACADLPEETEIIVSLEKDAGTVTLIDQDGNEHENFSTDYGFAGVMNEAIDAAIAAQAKNGNAQQ